MAATSHGRARDEGAVRALLAGRPPALRRACTFAALAFGLVLALRIWLARVGPMPGDQWARRHEDSVWLEPTPILDLGTFFSIIGTPVIAACTVLVGVLYAARVEGIRGAVFVVLAASGVAANAVLKELSGPTPLMVAINGGAGLNYPSGHTVYAVATFGAFAVLARRAGRLDIVAPLLVLLALMGPFRVIVSAHFVSDVVAGYLVGLAWLAVSAALALGRR